jgi:hypothetical protein
MQLAALVFPTFAILASFSLIGITEARPKSCSDYQDCKCHDSRTGKQDDAVTKKTCELYGGNAVYKEQPHHQVSCCTGLRVLDRAADTRTVLACWFDEQSFADARKVLPPGCRP